MSTSTENANMVIEKLWNLPRTFLGEELDSRVLTVFARAFKELLLKADSDDRMWSSRIATFHKHRLLEITIQKQLTIGRIEIDLPGRNGKESEKLVREMDKPINFGFDKHTLTIDRERIGKSDYLEEVASILAYMFIWRMVESGEPGLMFASSADKLVFLDELRSHSLAEFLDRFHQGQSTAGVFARFLLSKSVDESVDASDLFEGFDELEDRLKAKARDSFDAFAPRLEARLEEAARLAHEELDKVSERAKEESYLKCTCHKTSSKIGCGSPWCHVASKANCDCEANGSPEGCKRKSCDVIDVLTSHPVQMGHHSIEELVDANVQRHNFLNKSRK